VDLSTAVMMCGPCAT